MNTTVTTDYGKLPRDVALRVNEVCDRFEAAWRQGRAARVEEFLADTPEPIYTPLLRELVLLEMDYRRLSGEDSRPEEYRTRFPSLPPAWLEAQCPAAALAASGRYQFLGEIGRGGMGLVLRAHDAHCGRDVAVKVLLDRHKGDAPAEHRFLEGARLTSQLQHPGVPPVHEIGRLADGRPFFAMKLVQGRTLAELLEARPGPPEDLPSWLGIFTRVCQAVAYAHSRGVIHRDLKPGNVMVGAFGEVQVMDWGLAKVLDATRPGESAEGELPTDEAAGAAQVTLPQFASRAGAIMGTPAYMPPEQARGEVQRLDPRTDVFGLGAILCEILTGHPPYRARPDSNVLDLAVSADLTETFTRLESSQADAELTQLARTCLAADRYQRPGNAGVVAEAVAAHQAGVERRLRQAELERKAAEVRTREVRKRRRLRQFLAASLLVLAGLLGMGVLWYAWQHDQAHREATALLELAGDLQDHFRWAEARKALAQAGSRLQSMGSADLLDRIRQASADLEAAARLDAIRLKRWTVADGKIASVSAAQDYAAVFQEAGLTVAADTLLAVTERIKQSGIRKAWVAALDDWALTTGDRSLRQLLLQLAREADPDRNEWRARLREPATWEDRTRLEKLAATASLDEQGSPHLLTVLAQRLHATGGNPIPLLRSAQRRHPKDFWLNFMLGSLLVHREGEQAADAVGYLRAALSVRSDSGVVCNNLAVALEAWGRLDEAVSIYRDAIRHDPTYALAHNNLGVALAKKNQLDEAVAAYRDALRHDPTNARAHYNLGVALARQGQLDKAIASYLSAQRLDPKLTQADHNLGLALLQKRQADKALAALRAAIAGEPNNARLHFNLGNALADFGRLDEAIASYREAIRINPKDPWAHSNLGVALARQGLPDAAVAACREAVRKGPQDARTHYNLGNALGAVEQFDEAIAAYRIALQLDPRDARSLHNLAVALARKGRLDEAVAAYRSALHLTPDDAQGYCNLGMALVRQGKLDETVAAYRAALRIKPGYGKARYNLGVALARKGQFREAVESYEAAFQVEPRYTQAAFNRGPARADRSLLDEEPAASYVYRDGPRMELKPEIDFRPARLLPLQSLAKIEPMLYGAKLESRNEVLSGAGGALAPIRPEVPRAHYLLVPSVSAKGQPDEALAPSRDFLRLEPEEARALYNYGNALAALGEAESRSRAVLAYRDALRLDLRFVNAHKNLGVVLARQNNLEEAIIAYRDALDLDRKDAIAHNNLGVALARKGRTEEAIAAYRESLRLDPQLALAHYNLGNALGHSGPPDGVVAAYRDAIRLDPRDPGAHNNFGVALARGGLADEAVAAYREALRLAPELPEAHNNLGVALTGRGKLDEAVDAYRKAIHLDPKLAPAHNNLGIALTARGHLDAAIDACRDALRFDPTNARAYHNLGLALAQKGAVDTAIDAYRDALRFDPKFTLAHCNLGVALADKGRLDEAVEACRKAVSLDPRLVLAHYNLGNILAKQGALDEAIGAYRDALRLDPSLAPAQCNLGVVLTDKGRLDEALEAARKAVAANPKLAQAHYNLGIALAEQGKFAEAVAAYRRAVAVKPDFAEAHCNLGHALIDRGRLAEALEALERGHELGVASADWRYPSAAWVLRCRRMLALEPKLPAFLRGEKQVTDAADGLVLAELCQRPYQRRYAAAARFYAAALAADPKQALSLRISHRYNAACAAVRGAAGLDEPPPDAQEVTRLRQQALKWLRDDLVLWDRQLRDGTEEAKVEARQVLRGWQRTPVLAGVRDQAALARLPDAERSAWQLFWAEVDAVFRK